MFFSGFTFKPIPMKCSISLKSILIFHINKNTQHEYLHTCMLSYVAILNWHLYNISMSFNFFSLYTMSMPLSHFNIHPPHCAWLNLIIGLIVGSSSVRNLPLHAVCLPACFPCRSACSCVSHCRTAICMARDSDSNATATVMANVKWGNGKWVRKSRSKSCNAPARNCLMRLP